MGSIPNNVLTALVNPDGWHPVMLFEVVEALLQVLPKTQEGLIARKLCSKLSHTFLV